MPNPDYQDCMLPLLDAVANGTDYHIRSVTERVMTSGRELGYSAAHIRAGGRVVR